MQIVSGLTRVGDKYGLTYNRHLTDAWAQTVKPNEMQYQHRITLTAHDAKAINRIRSSETKDP